MIAHILHITIGQTFSGGFIDFILFGILQGNAKTNWVLVPVVGIIWLFLYFFTFTFFIKKFNFKTPGREEEGEAVVSINNKSERAQVIVEALGGKENLENVDCCATRLRVTVKNETAVDENMLKKTGAKGVLSKGKGIQVIYGPDVTIIKNEIEEMVGE